MSGWLRRMTAGWGWVLVQLFITAALLGHYFKEGADWSAGSAWNFVLGVGMAAMAGNDIDRLVGRKERR